MRSNALRRVGILGAVAISALSVHAGPAYATPVAMSGATSGATSGGAMEAPHVISASGPLAVLNGLAAIELKAVAPFPLGLPAPAGHLTMALQSTFEPPGPKVVTVTLWCTAVADEPGGRSFYGSGEGSDGRTWYLHLAPALPLWNFGWSTVAGAGPCGGGPASIPLIGPAAISP